MSVNAKSLGLAELKLESVNIARESSPDLLNRSFEAFCCFISFNFASSFINGGKIVRATYNHSICHLYPSLSVR